MKFYGLVDKENKIWIGDVTITAMLRTGKFKNTDELELKDFKYLCDLAASVETRLSIYKIFITSFKEEDYTEKEKKKFKDISEAILACKIKEINIEINIK